MGDNSSDILRFSRIFIHVLIGLALLWPINRCSSEVSIACEGSPDQHTHSASISYHSPHCHNFYQPACWNLGPVPAFILLGLIVDDGDGDSSGNSKGGEGGGGPRRHSGTWLRITSGGLLPPSLSGSP
jgi:hypothetical protein